jgi:hypothetical protein
MLGRRKVSTLRCRPNKAAPSGALGASDANLARLLCNPNRHQYVRISPFQITRCVHNRALISGVPYSWSILDMRLGDHAPWVCSVLIDNLHKEILRSLTVPGSCVVLCISSKSNVLLPKMTKSQNKRTLWANAAGQLIQTFLLPGRM